MLNTTERLTPVLNATKRLTGMLNATKRLTGMLNVTKRLTGTLNVVKGLTGHAVIPEPGRAENSAGRLPAEVHMHDGSCMHCRRGHGASL